MGKLTPVLAETLSVFEAAAPGTPLTTSEVADRLDLGRRSTYERLERLVDEGLLETKKVGANGRVWWRDPTDPAVTLATDPESRQAEDTFGALDSLNDVVREITGAAIEESTRDEIEQVVCERLAAADPYGFAWIGEPDIHSETVTPRVEAGIEGYLDEMTVSIDPDDPRGQGPGGRAIRTGEVQVVDDVGADSSLEPWRDHLSDYEYRSLAAVPITHEETLYGLLAVYADRSEALTGDERRMLGQLGEIVGHAIAAAERKQALLGDEVVEVEFRLSDAFEALGAAGAHDGRITLDQPVLIEEGEYLVYGTATADAVDSVHALVDAVPYWTAVSFTDDEDAGSPRRFELRLSNPPILTEIGERGGIVKEAVIENGDYQMRIHLPPSVPVREVIDRIEEGYPEMTMVARRQITIEDPAEERARLVDALSDRQLAALKTAYYSGYFNWPRDSTAEEIAESLDVSSPTVHKHLRRAQRKVLEGALTESTS